MLIDGAHLGKVSNKKLTSPEVSVVMSVYDGEKYLAEAIESILDQTLTDFEFIIIDDGSTDDSLAIIQKYSKQDERVIIVQNDKNIGLAASLNKGIQLAKGEFIARMDADDISYKNRLEIQIQRMRRDPKLLILGSAVDVIDENLIIRNKIYPPTAPVEIFWSIVTACKIPFIHPTVIFRNVFFSKVGFYDANVSAGQDYNLFSRIVISEIPVECVGNLSEKLLQYRVQRDNVSHRERKKQVENGSMARKQMYIFLAGLSAHEADGKNEADFLLQTGNLVSYISTYRDLLLLFVKKYRLNLSEKKDLEKLMLEHLGRRIALNEVFQMRKQSFFSLEEWLKILASKLKFKIKMIYGN
jgi:glycosyltransferase involved in cell wall biosynthesis